MTQPWQSWSPLRLYPRLIGHCLKLCWQHRTTPAVMMAANPIVPYGGLPFVPKSAMQAQFERVLPYIVLSHTDKLDRRQAALGAFMRQHPGPVILKPDTGHRGVGVVKCETKEAAVRQLHSQKWALIAQAYDDAPCEFGVFYARYPERPRGQIISLTQKQIPRVIGDGLATLSELIDRADFEQIDQLKHANANRHDQVVAKGQSITLLTSASHCRGAIFTDISDQVTPELDEALHQLCAKNAFYFGRFDVKADSVESFLNGEFRIIEVNGATSEFIHIYDAKYTLREALSELKRQWSLLFIMSEKSQSVHKIPVSMWTFLSRYSRFFWQTKRATGSWW